MREEYCLNHGSHRKFKIEDDCRALYEFTKQNVHASHMMIGPLEASILGFVLSSLKAKKVLEIGTFTGYSALSFAHYLPSDGEVFTLDINDENQKHARRFWDSSPQGAKIKEFCGPAIQFLNQFISEGYEFDFVFIDADKRNYENYLNLSLNLLSKNGVIAIDNVLWGDRVIEDLQTPTQSEHQLLDKNTEYLKEFNRKVALREDLLVTMLPIRDGITLIKKI